MSKYIFFAIVLAFLAVILPALGLTGYDATLFFGILAVLLVVYDYMQAF